MTSFRSVPRAILLGLMSVFVAGCAPSSSGGEKSPGFDGLADGVRLRDWTAARIAGELVESVDCSECR